MKNSKMSMNSQKIKELRDSLTKKDADKDSNPCPTNILLYIATGKQSFDSVDPWYGQIKKMSKDVNFHYGDFHKAAIYGMYPEIKPACEYFSNMLSEHFKKSEKISHDEAKQIEQKTINQFKLKSTYSFLDKKTKEQEQRVDMELKKATNEYVDSEFKRYSPVVQILGQALRQDAQDSFKLVSDMRFLDLSLKLGKEEYAEISRQEYSSCSEQFEMVDKAFNLQDKGVIDADLKVNDWNKFKQSDLVQGISYDGKKYNLAPKLMSPTEAQIITQGKIRRS